VEEKMIYKQRLLMAKHGAIVLFIGALAGLAYTFVITLTFYIKAKPNQTWDSLAIPQIFENRIY
jgi:hypothetical protein